MSTPVPSSTADLVRVFERDPSLLGGTDGAAASTLRDHGAAPHVRVVEGPWHPPSHRTSARNWMGLLLLDGFVARRTALGDRTIMELLGPGDLLRPWDRGPESGLVHRRTPWYVLAPASIAVLDNSFSAVAGRAPGVVAELMCRTLRRSTTLAAAVTVADGETVTERARRLLAHVADRFGAADADGTLLPPFLVDPAVAYLLGDDLAESAAAMEQLAELGEVTRRADGQLLLPAAT